MHLLPMLKWEFWTGPEAIQAAEHLKTALTFLLQAES